MEVKKKNTCTCFFFLFFDVCSTNHKEDFILETTDMPDELVREVGGKIVFEDVQPMVSVYTPASRRGLSLSGNILYFITKNMIGSSIIKRELTSVTRFCYRSVSYQPVNSLKRKHRERVVSAAGFGELKPSHDHLLFP